jgi:type IV pilus assembly protein PilP
MRSVLGIFLIFAAALALAQGGATPQSSPQATPPGTPQASASPSPATPAESPASTEVAKPSDLLNGIIEDYTYAPQGKRDPFAPFEGGEVGADAATLGPLFPLQKYDLDQLKLVGIIWEVKKPKAMVVDPTGNSHVVGINDRIGRNNGYVARIRQGEIVIVESYKEKGKTNYQTQVMKLAN